MSEEYPLTSLEDIVAMCEAGVIFTDSDYHVEKVISMEEMNDQIRKFMEGTK